MNSKRKKRVRARLIERRKFYNALRRMNRESYFLEKARRRLEPGTFRVTFCFGPEELGIDCKPTPESIEKLGLKRALERIKRQDFFINAPIIARGNPDAENLARIRAEVLESVRVRISKNKGPDFTGFRTTAGVSDEVNPGSAITTES